MEVICLQDSAFFSLVDRVVLYLQETTKKSEKWISGERAMEHHNIKSKTTLQKFRDEGIIRFSHPEKKWIVYDSDSINEYLEKHTKNTFQ